MKYLFLILCVIVSLPTLSRDTAGGIKPFRDSLIFQYDECKAIVADMSSGSLRVTDGDKLVVVCSAKNELSYDCGFSREEAKKLFATRVMAGGVLGAEGVLKSDSDEIIMSMISRTFIAKANINLDNGRVRGSKICSGKFLYASELKEE